MADAVHTVVVESLLKWLLGEGGADNSAWQAWLRSLSSGRPAFRGVAGVRFGGGLAEVALSVAEFHHAVDCRQLLAVRRFDSTKGSILLVEISGRHVGGVGQVIPTGRRFHSFVHVLVSPGLLGHQVTLESSLPLALKRFGVGQVDSQSVEASACQLLDGDVEATLWARRWRLPPRLARVALLLIAGLRTEDVAAQLGVSLKTVRTYIELLFARAGVGSRGELPLAALNASRLEPSPKGTLPALHQPCHTLG